MANTPDTTEQTQENTGPSKVGSTVFGTVAGVTGGLIAVDTARKTSALRILFPNEGDGIEAAVKARISIRAKAAAIEKHKTNRAARLRAIELYSTHNYPSVEAAAQAISKLVHKAPRTVANWLYAERKGRTPPVSDLQK